MREEIQSLIIAKDKVVNDKSALEEELFFSKSINETLENDLSSNLELQRYHFRLIDIRY